MVSVDHGRNWSSHVPVVAYGINKHNWRKVLKLVRRVRPKVLLHLSDEYGNASSKWETRVFPMVPLVYRQHRFDHHINATNVHILPLGYHCWDEDSVSARRSSDRSLLWSFIGTVKGERAELLNALRDVLPHFAGPTKHADNASILSDSQFVCCPHGNSAIECFRQYAAVRAGAVPVLLCEEREWGAIYAHFEFEPPWPHFETIEAVRTFLLRHQDRPERVQSMQDACLNWYEKMTEAVRTRIEATIERS
jgi:hypothetical protein